MIIFVGGRYRGGVVNVRSGRASNLSRTARERLRVADAREGVNA